MIFCFSDSSWLDESKKPKKRNAKFTDAKKIIIIKNNDKTRKSPKNARQNATLLGVGKVKNGILM